MRKYVVITFQVLISLIVVSLVLIFCNNNISNKFFGISFHVVVTNSMSGEIERGDIIVVRKKDISNVKVGQNILFINQDLGQNVVHKVIEKDNNTLITAGIYPSLKMDSEYVTNANFIGVAKQSEVLTILYKIFTNFLFWLIFLFVALLCMVRKYKYH